jgi:hypothetical protein
MPKAMATSARPARCACRPPSEDLAVLQAVSGKGKPVVTVAITGRPLYTNDLLNLSDSFVAAWLPGTEGKGVTDVLFRKADGKSTRTSAASCRSRGRSRPASRR